MRSEIEAEDIILRKYDFDYALLLFEAAHSSRGGEFTRWMPWCHENYSIDESESFIKLSIESWEKGTQYNFGVFDEQTNEFLGGVGINQPNEIHKFFNLGYWTRVSAQKRGIASRAARALAKAAFEDLDLNRLEILTATENIASQKAAEKAGALREGVLRKRLVIGGKIYDAVMFSFIREDFGL